MSAKGKEGQQPQRSYTALPALAVSRGVQTESHNGKKGWDRARERNLSIKVDT